jgi:hypothetical protein
MSAVSLIDRLHSLLEPNTALSLLEALSQLSDTEDFQTFKSQYIRDSIEIERLVRFKETVIHPIIKDVSLKKSIRSLLDCIERSQRLAKLK